MIPFMILIIPENTRRIFKEYSLYSSGGSRQSAHIGRPLELRGLNMSGINMFKVKDGRVAEQCSELEIFSLLQQIGASCRREVPVHR
jgi:hypothetical protein